MQSSAPLYPTPVIGHRGACALAPENTLASFAQAARDGAAMIEFDTKLTADSRAVVFHDDELERTTDGSGPVQEIEFQALATLDAGGWFAPSFAGEAVPSLEEVLDCALDHDLAVNIELKPCPNRVEETARVVLACAAVQWPETTPPPLISSFSRAALAVARDLAPTWPRALLCDTLPDDWREASAVLAVQAIHLGDTGLTPDTIALVKKAGLAVAVWTVNDADRARFLLAAGVDAVFSDDPGRLRAALS